MACNHYHDPAYMAAREKLTEAVKEYMNAMEPDGQSLMMGATVVYETTRFDDEGEQIYSVQHVILDPGSLAHACGLLTVARDRLSEYINRREED